MDVVASATVLGVRGHVARQGSRFALCCDVRDMCVRARTCSVPSSRPPSLLPVESGLAVVELTVECRPRAGFILHAARVEVCCGTRVNTRACPHACASIDRNPNESPSSWDRAGTPVSAPCERDLRAELTAEFRFQEGPEPVVRGSDSSD